MIAVIVCLGLMTCFIAVGTIHNIVHSGKVYDYFVDRDINASLVKKQNEEIEALETSNSYLQQKYDRMKLERNRLADLLEKKDEAVIEKTI